MFLVTACSEKVLFMVKTKVKSDWNTSLFVLFIMRKPQVTNLSLSRHPTLCDSREGMYNRYCCFYGERTKKLKRLWPCEWLKILVRPSLTKTWPVGWKTWITRHGLGSWFFPCLRASGCKILKQKYRRDSKFCASPSPPPFRYLAFQNLTCTWDCVVETHYPNGDGASSTYVYMAFIGFKSTVNVISYGKTVLR